MKRILVTAAAVIIASPALAQPPGSASSPIKAEVVNEVDTKVLNEVDVNVTNSISVDGLTEIRFTTGIGGGEGAATLGLPAGTLHAASLSVHPEDPGNRCTVTAAIVYGDTFDGDKKTIGLGAISWGETQSITQNYVTPIEVTADGVQGDPRLAVYINSFGTLCWIHLTAMYEPSDPLATMDTTAKTFQMTVTEE